MNCEIAENRKRKSNKAMRPVHRGASGVAKRLSRDEGEGQAAFAVARLRVARGLRALVATFLLPASDA